MVIYGVSILVMKYFTSLHEDKLGKVDLPPRLIHM